MTTVNKVFATLSISNDPNTNTKASFLVPSPISLLKDNKTIMHDPKEHHRQCKIARHQHMKQTLRWLRDSDDLFLDNSISLTEDERTSLAKCGTSNKKHSVFNSAHTKHGTTSIGFAQRGHNAAYSLGSAFNRTIKKINKNKHVSFATHNKVHQ